MTLRCTARLLDLIRASDLTPVQEPPADDDWYANLLTIDRRKCLLLMHASTLFPVFCANIRKRDVRAPGPFVIAQIRAALAQEQLHSDALGPLDARDVRLARTASRSVLGHMNEAALDCRHAIDAAGASEPGRSTRRSLESGEPPPTKRPGGASSPPASSDAASSCRSLHCSSGWGWQ